MPDRIYTVQVCEKIEKDPKTEFPDFGDERLVGFYFSKSMAFKAVKDNWG